MSDYKFDITVEITASPDSTIVKLRVGEQLLSVGTSKRHPSDVYSEATGNNLAMQRALKNYADSLQDITL